MNSCNNQTVPCAGPEALIPCCQPTNYGAAAAFRFNLPDCRRGGEQNEYVVFVVPRLKDDQPTKALTRRPCPTRYTPRPACQDFEPPDGCTQRTYISVAGCSPPRACGQNSPAARPKPPSCDFNRWSTEYRSTIDECARWVLNSDVCCKRRPIYPLQCLISSPCRNQTTPDEDPCAESRPTVCTAPPACYQRTCEPVNFKQAVVTPYPTRPPVDRSLPCPKPTITTSTPTTSNRTGRTNPTTNSPVTSKRTPASPTTARQITAVPSATRRRRSPQPQVDQQCEEDPHCCTSPSQPCPQMVGTRRPLPRCKMPDSQACI